MVKYPIHQVLRVKWLACVVAIVPVLAGCTSTLTAVEEVDPAAGDAWRYELVQGDGTGFTEWVVEDRSFAVTRLDTGRLLETWGDGDGLRAVRSLGEGTFVLLFDRACSHVSSSVYFRPTADLDCSMLLHAQQETDRFFAVFNPQARVVRMPNATVDTALGSFEAERLRVDVFERVEGGVSPAESRVYWTVPDLCAPVRIDRIDTVEGTLRTRYDLIAARCGGASWGESIGQAPLGRADAAKERTTIGLWSECRRAAIVLAPDDDPQAATCTSRELTAGTSMAGHRPVHISVEWSSAAPVEHTLRVGPHDSTGTSPLALDVTVKDLLAAGNVTAESVVPDYMDRYTFRATYDMPFPVPPGVPVDVDG